MAAIAVAVLVVYSSLFASGEYLQAFVYTSQEKLQNQLIDFRGPYPNLKEPLSNLTLHDLNGQVLFFLMFRTYWPSANYTGDTIFDGDIAVCPTASVSLHSVDFWYKYNGNSPPDFYLNPTSLMTWPGSSVQANVAQLPGGWFELMYNDLQKGFPSQCGGLGISFETVGGYAYSYNLQIDATLYDMSPSLTPFIGQTYTLQASIPIAVSSNGTVTLGSTAE